MITVAVTTLGGKWGRQRTAEKDRVWQICSVALLLVVLQIQMIELYPRNTHAQVAQLVKWLQLARCISVSILAGMLYYRGPWCHHRELGKGHRTCLCIIISYN